MFSLLLREKKKEGKICCWVLYHTRAMLVGA